MTDLKWTIEDLIAATRADCIASACTGPFADIRIDSRICGEGDVFVAIAGQRFDGHDFIESVIDQGTRCIIAAVDKKESLQIEKLKNSGFCILLVPDTVVALGDLAGYQRLRAAIPVIAITGSNGKTTTKEMTASILRQRYQALSTMGNYNNEIGLPLTLFNLEQSHEVAVVELGMNHPGEIRRLSAICRPNIGIITNIGPAHLEGLGDVDTVARAKGELLENIAPDDSVILNADDAYGLQLKARANCRVTMFGVSAEADIRAENITPHDGGFSFSLITPDGNTDIFLKIHGEFMTYNALAAAAAAHKLGLSLQEIKAGLESFAGVKGRMAIRQTPGGAYVIDDTYNANPGSMAAAINALTGVTGKKRGILVAGDMLELGSSAGEHHEQIGRIAAEAGVTRLYLTGEQASRVAQGARRGGMPGHEVFVGTKSDIIKDLTAGLRAGDWVLVKGSRSTGMEQIVEQLITDHTVSGGDDGYNTFLD